MVIGRECVHDALQDQATFAAVHGIGSLLNDMCECTFHPSPLLDLLEFPFRHVIIDILF